MGLGSDGTYSGASRIYIKQQPEGVSLNGQVVTTEEVTDVGGLQTLLGLSSMNGQILPGKIGFTFTPGAANVCKVSIQVQDNGGQTITRTDGGTSTAPTVYDLDIVLALSTGVVTTLTPSTGLSVVTGTLLSTYSPSAARALYVQTNNAGLAEVNVTDTGKQGFFVMVQGGCQPIPALSRAMVTGDYG